MEILYLDNDEKIKYLLIHFKTLEPEWNIIDSDNFSLSNIEEIDIVIVDFSKNFFKTILDEIIKVKPDIRTITISEELKNSISNGCKECIDCLNRRRLIKPITPKKLYEQIKNFDNKCDFYDAFNNIENLLPIIVQRFSLLEYDNKNKKVISINNSSDSYNTYQFLSMINILDKNDIDYTVLDENNLQINM